MADNKKYYYLKLKENFYDSEQLIILQNMQDGYLYSDILMKLYLRSLKTNGKLMFNNIIPYTPNVLAQVVRHQVGTVEKALKIFKDLGLIEILDNGAIYMSDIQNFIGKSSTEADRIRNYRQEISTENKRICTNVQQMYNKCTPEIEIEKEIEKEINKEKKIKSTDVLTPLILNNNFYKENEDLKQKVIEWLQYKKERKEVYKETGFKSLLKQIENKTKNFSKEDVICLIDECMANNWKGIIFEKLVKKERDPYAGVKRL